MTEVANTAALEVARKLTASEVIYSLEFVTKLAKKIAKDNPGYTVAQIVLAMDKAFADKLAATTKRLAGLEKTQQQYAVLKSAQPMIASVGEALTHVATLDYQAHVVPAAAAKVVAKKANGKANGAAADVNQPALL